MAGTAAPDHRNSLGDALSVTIGDPYQGFASSNGKVYLVSFVGDDRLENENAPVILAFDPEDKIVSLAVPYQSLRRGLLSPGTFPSAAAYGLVLDVFAPPLTGFDDAELLMLCRCELDCVKRDYVMMYNTKTKVLQELIGDGFGLGPFGRFGSVGQPQDRSTVLYSHPVGHVLKYDVVGNLTGVASGIGAPGGQEPVSPHWADQLKLGISYGMAYTSDDKQLWIANRGDTRQALIRVSWRDTNSELPQGPTPVPLTPVPAAPTHAPEQPRTPQPSSSSSSQGSGDSSAEDEEDPSVAVIVASVAVAVALVAVGVACALWYKMRSSSRQWTPVMGEVIEPPVVVAEEIALQKDATA